MDAAKIEMEAVREAIRQLKENGYEEFVPGKNISQVKDSTTTTAANL